MELVQVGTRVQVLRRTRLGRRGQNTVEYLLMLGVIVGLVLVVGVVMKRAMPDIWQKVQGKIMGAVDQGASQ